MLSRRQFMLQLSQWSALVPSWPLLRRFGLRQPAGDEVDFFWSGALTPTSIVVIARVLRDSDVRCLVSAAGTFDDAIASQPAVATLADNNRTVRFELSGLTPETAYTYAIEVDGVRDTSVSGRFQTPGVGQFDFAIAFASCSHTNSTRPVFDTIRNKQPLFFLHMGDMHYRDISVDDVNAFREAWAQSNQSVTQGPLYRSTPLAYMWDDHDFGPNNSNETAPGRMAARLAYQEAVPHYPLPAGSGDVAIYQAFTIGRVRFILTDLRSERDPQSTPNGSDKTMMGAEQKAWFKQELLDSAQSHVLLVWVNTVPWIATNPTGDAWGGYADERRELANFIRDNGIANLLILSGDAHMLAIDDGSNSDWADGGGAPIPVIQAAALHQQPSFKGGPYSEGALPGSGQFGWMTVVDSGDTVTVDLSGRNTADEELIALQLQFDGQEPTAIRRVSATPPPSTEWQRPALVGAGITAAAAASYWVRRRMRE